MFSNAYQGGTSVQVWDCKVTPDKNAFYKQLCKLPAKPAYFDKEAKTYLCELSAQNANIQLPADSSRYLGLTQTYLVLQLFVPLGQHWSLQLTLSDLLNAKRRLNLTTQAGKLEGKFFSCRCPLDGLPRGQWLFLGVDLPSFMPAFEQGNFRALDQIVVGSTCRIRRMFTMKQFNEISIPKHYWLAQDIAQQLYLIKFGETPQLREQASVKQSISPKMSKVNSPNRSVVTQKREDSKPKSLQKSEVIIENAKHRLNNLEKEEQKILNRSKEIQQQSFKPKPFVRSPPYKHPKEDKAKSKLPFINKNFHEDLLKEEEDSSNMAQSRQISKPIGKQQNTWSGDEFDQPRPIQQAAPIKGTFPSTILTRENNRSIQLKGGFQKSSELQLIFDEMVGCYYHPESNSYFQLR